MIWNCCPPCGTKLLIGAAVRGPARLTAFAKAIRPYVVALPMPKSYAGEPLLVNVELSWINPLFSCIVPLLAKGMLWIVVVPVAVLFRNVPVLLKPCAAAQQFWYINWSFVTLNKALLLLTPAL